MGAEDVRKGQPFVSYFDGTVSFVQADEPHVSIGQSDLRHRCTASFFSINRGIYMFKDGRFIPLEECIRRA